MSIFLLFSSYFSRLFLFHFLSISCPQLLLPVFLRPFTTPVPPIFRFTSSAPCFPWSHDGGDAGKFLIISFLIEITIHSHSEGVVFPMRRFTLILFTEIGALPPLLPVLPSFFFVYLYFP